MRMYLIVLIVLELIVGALFLSEAASDIQLGFGLVLIFMGLGNIYQLKRG